MTCPWMPPVSTGSDWGAARDVGKCRWYQQEGLGKKGQEQARETKVQETRQVCGPSRQRGKRLQVQMLGAPEQARGRAPGAGGGPGLDPGEHRRGRRGLAVKGVLPPRPAPP